MTIPDPPEGGPGGGPPCETFDELFDSLQAFAKANGFAVVKGNAANRREGEYTSYSIQCDLRAQKPTTSLGIRRSTTRSKDCAWKGWATKPAKHGGFPGWRFKLATKEERRHHCHEASLNPAAHPAHRRLTEAQRSHIDSMSKFPSLRSREAGLLARENDLSLVMTDKDLDNARQAFRMAQMDGYSATQAFLRSLQEEGCKYKTRVINNRLEAVAWTYPPCEEIWQRFPEVASFDFTYRTNKYSMPLFTVSSLIREVWKTSLLLTQMMGMHVWKVMLGLSVFLVCLVRGPSLASAHLELGKYVGRSPYGDQPAVAAQVSLLEACKKSGQSNT